jgi:hypothetical protein
MKGESTVPVEFPGHVEAERRMIVIEIVIPCVELLLDG